MDHGGPTLPVAVRRGGPLVGALVAGVLQTGVLFLTVVMGLQWGGVSYAVAVLQALLCLGVIAWLARRRSWMALVVPVISFALTVGLFFLGVQRQAQTACTPEMRAATATLAPPPGATVQFEGEAGNGCIARFSLRGSSADTVREHYLSEFGRQGWQVKSQTSTEVFAVKGRLGMSVSVLAQESDGGLVVIRIADDHS